jgi:hypothetical protein
MSSGCRSAAAHPLSRGGTIAGEIRSCAPLEREARAGCDADAVGDDYWAGGVDLLILRVADHLRRAGADMPEELLRRVAEEVVLDAARFVLDWAEGPVAARAAPAPARRGGE